MPVAATASQSASESIEREVTVQFISHVSRGMPWEFRPTESRLRVRLGEVTETMYYARNFANRIATGQAVPSVTPGYAARYLHKVECFCFTQQHLEPGEELDMPVYFYVGEDLPSDIGTLTLSYTMYPVSTDAKQSSVSAEEPPGGAADGSLGALCPMSDSHDTNGTPRYYVPHTSVWPIVGLDCAVHHRLRRGDFHPAEHGQGADGHGHLWRDHLLCRTRRHRLHDDRLVRSGHQGVAAGDWSAA